MVKIRPASALAADPIGSVLAMMNKSELGALCPTSQRSAAGREREDGYSNPVRIMGRFPAGIATHLRLRHIPALAFGRLTASRGNDVRQTGSVPGPPAVTIPRITVVARSGVRSIEILVAINPPGDGPSPIRPIAVSRLVADDLRRRDQRIRSRLTMA